MALQGIEGIIWDVDGVLANTFPQTYALDCEIIRRRTGSSPNIETYKGNPHRGNWKEFYAYFGVQDGETALKEYYNLFKLEEITAIPGVAEVLSHSKVNNRVNAIVSINREKQRVLQKLQIIGLSSHFREENIYVTKGDKTSKLREVCDQYLLPPRSVLFVTDTVNDVRAAHAAGLRSAAVANEWSYDAVHLLRGANPTVLLDNITQLPVLLS
jgi:phosphoglycolate phosphatase-like HAD superfamily hydrolase